jgi:hypothetical protein
VTLTQPQKGRKYTLLSASSFSVHPEQEKDGQVSVAVPVITIINQSAISERGFHASPSSFELPGAQIRDRNDSRSRAQGGGRTFDVSHDDGCGSQYSYMRGKRCGTIQIDDIEASDALFTFCNGELAGSKKRKKNRC